MMQQKLLPFEMRPPSATGIFEGYASVFDAEDMGHDIVLRGAFRKTLTKRGTDGIRMLFQHDPAQPIGRWLVLEEDGYGLFVRGQLAPGAKNAQDILQLLKAGALDGLSIGFKVVNGRRDGRARTRMISELDLWEISIVTFPMQPGARVANVKSLMIPVESGMKNCRNRQNNERPQRRRGYEAGRHRHDALPIEGGSIAETGVNQLAQSIRRATRLLHQSCR